MMSFRFFYFKNKFFIHFLCTDMITNFNLITIYKYREHIYIYMRGGLLLLTPITLYMEKKKKKQLKIVMPIYKIRIN